MNENSLLLEMYRRKYNRGTLIFRSDAYPNPVKVKGMVNALEFVAELILLAKAIAAGTYQNGHLVIKVKDPNKHWFLHYCFMAGIVDLVLMFKDISISGVYKAMFIWAGSAAQFVAAVDFLSGI